MVLIDALCSYLVLSLTCLWTMAQRPPDFLQAFTLYRSRNRFQKKSHSSPSIKDLRQHQLFHSSANLDCCPTQTELRTRTTGINPQGILLELFHAPNFTQTFYETFCHMDIKERPCQFIDPQYAPYSRCVQQFSYVYALGRTFLHLQDQFRIDFIRIATGCKCRIIEENIVEDLLLDRD